MNREELTALPCPFCGKPPMVFKYNGTMKAQCQGAYGYCAGNHVMAPLAMWNKRADADLIDQQAARIKELEYEMQRIAWHDLDWRQTQKIARAALEDKT